MNTFSHLIFGRLLHQYLSEQRGIRLSRRGFISGNMLPDFTPYYKKLPHEPEYWARFLKSEIAGLSWSKVGDTRFGTRFGASYSKRLGIVCHFYADFFCYAHTAAFTGGTLPHLQYEWALHRHMCRHVTAPSGVSFASSAAENMDAGAIFSDFRKLCEEYADLPPSYDKDISFTLRACAGVITAVTANSIAGDSVGDVFTGIALPKGILIAGAENSI